MMRPDQCGTGRNLRSLHPGDRDAIIAFGKFLQTRKAATEHRVAVEQIVNGERPRQLIAAPPYRVDDFVKVVDPTDPHVGRWGIVTEVHDYRDGDVARPDRLEFLIMVALKTTRRGVGLVDYPPGPVPFEPCEIAPLFAGEGDWVRSGRVVSGKNWPARRSGLTEAL